MKIILAVLSPLLVLFIGNSKTTEEHVDGLFQKAYNNLELNLDSSYFYADLALKISEDKNLEWHQANSRFIKGYVHEERGQYSKSILLYLEAINILKGLHDERSKQDQTKLLINCGNILRKHFKFDDAIRIYDEALLIAKKNQLYSRITKIHFNKSLTYLESGDFDLAINSALNCNKVAIEMEDERMMINSWNQLGIIHMESGFYEESVNYYQAIIDHSFIHIDGIKYKGIAYHNIANLKKELKEHITSEEYYKKAVELFESLNRSRDLFLSYKGLTSLYLDTKKFDQSKTVGDLALSLYDKMPLTLENYQLFKNLSELNFQTGNFELAKRYIDKYHSENEAFIENRNFIAQQSDKFKIEVVLAGYYDQIKSREQVAKLTNWLIFVLVVSLIIVGVGYWRWKWIKSQLELELRAHFKELSEIFSPNPLRD